MNPQLEAGAGLDHERQATRPADILVPTWELGESAALDITVVNPLNYQNVESASTTPGSTVANAEQSKLRANGSKCRELGWLCVPIALTPYGEWGTTAQKALKTIANRLASQISASRNEIHNAMMVRIGVTLVRSNARAILS